MNGEWARASRVLEARDTVEVDLSETRPAPRVLRPFHRALTVRFEDDALLVLDKPAGLVVHPAPGHWEDTLVNALVARGTTLGGGAAGRPGLVHRLDKDTSGLMLVAKSDEVHRALSQALARRRVERVYAALIWGHLVEPRTIRAPIARHPKDRKRMAVLATGRDAATRVEPIARFDLCDLVCVTLATGRTHQIRVHLAHIGHPVVGDPVYGGGGPRRVTGALRPQAETLDRLAPRQALHAALLRFAHPLTGAPCEFRSDWPEDLRELLGEASGEQNLLARPNVLDYLRFFA